MRVTEQDKHGQQRGVSILLVLQAAILATPRGSWLQTFLALWFGGGGTRAPPPDGDDRVNSRRFVTPAAASARKRRVSRSAMVWLTRDADRRRDW